MAEVVRAAGLARLRRIVVVLAIAYPIVLVAVVLAFSFLGERWWVTGLALYLPRLAFGAPLPVLVVALVAARSFKLLLTQLAAAIVLVFPLMGLVITFPRAAAEAPVLRVLSYNVDDAQISGSYDGALAEIDRYNPDIACLVDASAAIVPKLGARYPFVFARSQFVVAARYPMVETTEPPMAFIGGHMQDPRYLRVILDTPMGRLAMYCVHPVSPRKALYSARGIRGGILGGRAAATFARNEELRERQVQLFTDAVYREAEAVIVAGDTNLPGLSLILRRYLTGLRDGFGEAGEGLGYTFPTDKRIPPWMRIDRILANDGLRFVRFQVGTSGASDHHCVVADLQRR